MTDDLSNDGDETLVPYLQAAAIVSSYADPDRMSFDWLERFVPDLVERSNALIGSDSTRDLYLGTSDWRSKHRKYSAKTFSTGVEGLRAGTLDMLTVSTDAFSMVAFLKADPIEKRLVSTFEFWLKRATPYAGLFQDELLKLVVEGSVETDSATAYVNIDEDDDPYRDAIICEAEMYPGFLRHVYGYYWFTVLSPSHIAVLAEHDRRIEDAPVFELREIAGGRVGLQLSESILDYSDDQLKALRTFLGPLLRPGPLGSRPTGRTFETEDRLPT